MAKKRGRPKGSKNQVKKVQVKKAIPKKRGRPKGSTNLKKSKKKAQVKQVRQVKQVAQVRQIRPVAVEARRRKSAKRTYLGDCRCGVMIMGADKVSSVMYFCPGCGKKCYLSKLKKGAGTNKFENQREYMEMGINAEHHDMPPMVDAIDISKPLFPDS